NAAARAAREEAQLPPPSRPQYPIPAPHEQDARGNRASPQPNEPQSPNAVKTPQQIFEQLQRIRQQQQTQQNQQ
ncbi:MAG: hypothetical protein ABI158_11955, partial [Edaphobacter sp.]